MNQGMMTAISAGLVPIVFFLIQYFIAGPLGKLAQKYLPPKIAEALTRQRGEKTK